MGLTKQPYRNYGEKLLRALIFEYAEGQNDYAGNARGWDALNAVE